MLLGIPVLLSSLPAHADTLWQAFSEAYQANPALRAQQAQLASAAANIDKAESGWRPKVALKAGFGSVHDDISSPFFPITTANLQTRSLGLAITQPLYTGGQVSADVDAAQSTFAAQSAGVKAVEQQIFVDVARVYMNVLRDQAVLRLEQNNEKVLQQQLKAVQASFVNGEVTHTDVAQAQARLAGARAARIHAEGELIKSRAAYVRIVGVQPKNLRQPQLPENLPGSQEDSVALAQQDYQVLVARYQEEAARHQAEAVSGKLLPQVSLTGAVINSRDPEIGFDRVNERAIMLQVSLPLYEGGALRAEEQSARHQVERLRDEARDRREAATLAAIQSWQSFQTAHAQLIAIKQQITAAMVAYTGVKAEAKEGERTTLDVLDAEQELLNAKVNLVRAQRDYLLSAYMLKAATGQLTATDLRLAGKQIPVVMEHNDGQENE